MPKLCLHTAMVAQQWEITKGHLRSMTALHGSVSSGQVERPLKYEKVGSLVEKFIQDFEAEAFNEGID